MGSNVHPRQNPTYLFRVAVPTIGCDYQMRQRSDAGRTIGEPVEQPKAFANEGIFDSGPFVRNRGSAWGSVATRRRSIWGRPLVAQISANERKKRWSGLNPSILGGAGWVCVYFS